MKLANHLLVLLLSLVITLPAMAGSPVWKVTKGDQHLFIGGTIHVLTEADYPLPKQFDEAYQQSARLVLETDIQKLQSPELQQTLLQKTTYTDGRNLQKVLSEDTYLALTKHCVERGIPLASLLNLKPGMLTVVLTMMELQRLGLTGTGVDAFYNLRALNDQKKLGQLETAKEQIEFLSEMGAGQEDALINHTLRDFASLPEMMRLIKNAWRQGNLAEIDGKILKSFKDDFPKVFDNLLVKRNYIWLPQIEAMLKTREVELILVGTLHLAGNNGLLEMLSAQGYGVQML